MQTLSESIAKKVLSVVDSGLVSGMGTPTPGHMCVEAAVCFAYGLPHSDNPPCVGNAVRFFKITLNDSTWSSNKARTNGMRQLAIAQLGSDSIDQTIFVEELTLETIRQILPVVLRLAKLESHALKCEQASTLDAAWDAAKAAEWAAWAAAVDTAGDAAKVAEWAAWAAEWAAWAAEWPAEWAAAKAAKAAAVDTAGDAAKAAKAATWAAGDAEWAARAAAKAATWAAGAAARDAAGAAARDAAWAAGDAARDAAGDGVLLLMAAIGLTALKKCNSPGCQYLYLCEE